MDGKLICLTGLDGCGKSTQVNLLYNWTKSMDYPCDLIDLSNRKSEYYKILRECVNTLKAQNQISMPLELRGAILAFENLIHIKKVVLPALKEGKIVITDRYIETPDIYLESRNIDNYWPNLILNQVPAPDLFLFIDVPCEICYERLKQRGEALDPHENIETLRKIQENYYKKAEKYNFKRIDGTGRPEEVFERIKNYVKQIL